MLILHPLYSEEYELAMDLSVKFFDNELAITEGYLETIAEKYDQFQFMIRKIHIWDHYHRFFGNRRERR